MEVINYFGTLYITMYFCNMVEQLTCFKPMIYFIKFNLLSGVVGGTTQSKWELCSHMCVVAIVDNSTCIICVYKVAVKACLYETKALKFKDAIYVYSLVRQ